MIIALTGTPGTGKTTACRIIKEHSQYKRQFFVIDLNKLVLDEKLYAGRDEKRDTYIADIERLEERVKKIINDVKGMDVLMEGHLSHFLPADVIIVLRAHPVALRKRLGNKNYSFEKIRENAEAEALDVILVESAERNKNVFEINTTDANPLAVVKSIVSIIESLKQGKTPEDFLPGKINWIACAELLS